MVSVSRSEGVKGSLASDAERVRFNEGALGGDVFDMVSDSLETLKSQLATKSEVAETCLFRLFLLLSASEPESS